MKIGELLVALGFEGAGEMMKSLDGLTTKTLSFANNLYDAIKQLNAMTEAAREHAYAMDLYEKTTGKSADELQNLSYRAAQFNITQEQLAGTLRNIQQISTDVRLGRGMPSAFTLFGIDPNQDPAQILNKVQQAIKTLDAPTALNIASELGIDEKMFYMLKMTSKGMEGLNKQYRITAQERGNLIKLNAEWQKFWFLLKQIQTKFQSATASLQADAIKRFLEIANRIADMASAFMKAVEASTALKVAVSALGVALTAYFAPWLLILGAVFLVLEDIYTYFEGGDSITRRIVAWVKQSETLQTRFEVLKVIFETIKGTVSEIVRYFKEAYQYWNTLANGKLGQILKQAWGNAKDSALNFLDPFGPLGGVLDLFGKVSGIGKGNVNNTINNTFYSNEAPTREDIAGASSDALYQLEAAA